MDTPTILVTGATGNVGRPLVAGLLADGARVRALTRDPAAAGFPPGVAVTGGDYAAPGSIAEAVRGADAVFVNIGALREHVGELIAAARGTVVSRIVMLSSIAVLMDSGHNGQTYTLTGAESLTQIQQAEAIGKAIGRPVRFEELSPGQFRQSATQHLPAPVVEDLLKALASYVGQTAYMTADLEKIIGRSATSYAQWAVQHADAYR